MIDDDGDQGFWALPNYQEQVQATAKILQRMDVSLLKHVIGERLAGRNMPGLPGWIDRSGAGSPANIFIDAETISKNPRFTRNLRKAISEITQDFAASRVIDKATATEICRLAANGTLETITPLASLLKHPDASEMLPPDNDTLRFTALRSLVGLLEEYHDSEALDRESLRSLLEDCLRHPDCEGLALTALVGLWPQEQQKFLSVLPLERQGPCKSRLDIGLRWSGFTDGKRRPNIVASGKDGQPPQR